MRHYFLLNFWKLLLALSFASSASFVRAQGEASEPIAPPKNCAGMDTTVRALSLERRDAGELFFTFDVENKSNNDYRIGSTFSSVTLVDNTGDTWTAGKTNFNSAKYMQNTKTKVTYEFKRKFGGKDATKATVQISFQIPGAKCKALFNDLPIKQ